MAAATATATKKMIKEKMCMNFKSGSNAIENSRENLSALFFDLDNTLIPTRVGDCRAVRKIADALENTYCMEAECATRTTTNFLRAFRACPDNSTVASLDDWRTTLWRDALPETHKHLADQIYRKWLRLRYRYVNLSEEHAQLLLHIRRAGYSLALITNGPSCAQWEKVTRLQLRQYFDCILVSDDLPWEKPDPNIFRVACGFLNVRPHECAMIGDKLETDIKGGKCASLGLTIWTSLKAGDTCPDNAEVQPDIRLDNLMEICNLLPKLGDVNSVCRLATLNNNSSSSSSSSNSNNNNNSKIESPLVQRIGTIANASYKQLYCQRRNLQLKQHLRRNRFKRRGSLPGMECFSSETENSCDSSL